MDLRRTARAVPERLVALGIFCFAPMAALDGAARAADLLVDGFEGGTTCRWSLAVPADAPPGADCGLESFAPAMTFLREGATASPTIPVPLRVRLFRPATTTTFVAISSGDPDALTVTGGGSLIPSGESSAVVTLDGLQQSAGVTLTATLDSIQLQSTVRVVGTGEIPELLTFDPDEVSVAPGGSVGIDVVFDLPLGPGGVAVLLDSTLDLGTVPDSVTVLQDQLRASFTYLAGNVTGDDIVTGTDTVTSVAAVIHITPP